MKANYKTIEWLEVQWKTRALVALNDDQIAAAQTALQKVIKDNQSLYEALVIQLRNERAQFRREHPRMDFPANLRNVVRPPDLQAQFSELMNRRTAELRRIYRAEREKRDSFLNRMAEGRRKAMQRRQSSIRQIINRCAIAQGIKLDEKSLVLRLERLLDELTKKKEVIE